MNSLKTMTRRGAGKILAKLANLLLNALSNKSKGIKFSREELRTAAFSFSQFGEDRFILHCLRDTPPAVYLDIGAYDHSALSNTLLLYKRGWRGINVDLSQRAIDSFSDNRPEDFNVVCAVMAEAGEVVELCYEDGNLNRVVPLGETQLEWCAQMPVASRVVSARTIMDIINDSSFSASDIQFINIDCEGNDLKVLAGVDFSVVRPALICIELRGEMQRLAALDALSPYGYTLEGFLGISAFFIKAS